MSEFMFHRTEEFVLKNSSKLGSFSCFTAPSCNNLYRLAREGKYLTLAQNLYVSIALAESNIDLEVYFWRTCTESLHIASQLQIQVLIKNSTSNCSNINNYITYSQVVNLNLIIKI